MAIEEFRYPQDPEELVRHEAAEALGDLGIPTALGALEKALQDGSSVVSETARLAILQIRKNGE